MLHINFRNVLCGNLKRCKLIFKKTTHIIAVLQIKKHKVFLSSQATHYALNISYQKRERKPIRHTHQSSVPINAKTLYHDSMKKIKRKNKYLGFNIKVILYIVF